MKPLCFLLLASSVGATPVAAHAQDASWNLPYGTSASENTAWNNPIRDANGNLEIVNGIIQTGDGAFSSLAASDVAGGSGVGTQIGAARATAYGNQLNVVTSGKFNTVIVNSTQINNGDVIASAGAAIGAEGDSDDQ
jgi:holdfast attachment protein HfaA